MSLDGVPAFPGIMMPLETAAPPGSPQLVPQLEEAASDQQASSPAPASPEKLDNPNPSEPQALPAMAWNLETAQEEEGVVDAGEAAGMAEGVLLKVGG
jgi:hypothetical protein